METALIVMAWVAGFASGAVLLMGVFGLITGQVVINPRRIDWSVREGRLLGAIVAIQGSFLGAATLVTVLQLAANISTPPVLMLFVPLVTFGGVAGFFAVGRSHDARNPAKRYWSW